MSITAVPHQVIINNIFSHLELPELAAVCRVSNLCNNLASCDAVWKPRFEKEFSGVAINQDFLVKAQYKARVIKEIAEIEREYPSEILKVFGGAKKVRKFPVLTGIFRVHNLTCEEITQNISLAHALFIRGKEKLPLGRSFLLVKTTSNDLKTINLHFIAKAPEDSFPCYGIAGKYFPQCDYYPPHLVASSFRSILNGKDPSYSLAKS